MVAYAVIRDMILVDLHDINLMLGGEMIAKVVNGRRQCRFLVPPVDNVTTSATWDTMTGARMWSGQQRAAPHRPQKLVLRRKERPVMNKTGECFVKHVY